MIRILAETIKEHCQNESHHNSSGPYHDEESSTFSPSSSNRRPMRLSTAVRRLREATYRPSSVKGSKLKLVVFHEQISTVQILQVWISTSTAFALTWRRRTESLISPSKSTSRAVMLAKRWEDCQCKRSVTLSWNWSVALSRFSSKSTLISARPLQPPTCLLHSSAVQAF